jgi:FkbM family methyltransferase
MKAEHLSLVVHHVGGRDGGGPFSLPSAISVDSPIVYYEADTETDTGMISGARPSTVVAKCVGETRSQRVFNITAKPHASSLRTLDPKYADAYVSRPTEDRVWGITFAVARTVKVETEPLDEIVYAERGAPAPPDILTLDTEGTEFEILRGASKTIDQELVCIVTEASILPLREGQKLLGDILEFLSERNFIPIRIQPHSSELSLFRFPVGIRGEGIQAISDVVFLRDLDSAMTTWAGTELAVKLRKLALAAISFGQLEYGVECIKRARSIGLPKVGVAPRYWEFLDKLERSIAMTAVRYPPIAGAKPVESETTGAKQNAFEMGGRKETSYFRKMKSHFKSCLMRMPGVFSGIVWVITFYWSLSARINLFLMQRFASFSPVENVLREYGFIELSKLVRMRRLEQRPWSVGV